MADWDQCYYTFDGAYEAAQLKVFQEMHSKVSTVFKMCAMIHVQAEKKGNRIHTFLGFTK